VDRGKWRTGGDERYGRRGGAGGLEEEDCEKWRIERRVRRMVRSGRRRVLGERRR